MKIKRIAAVITAALCLGSAPAAFADAAIAPATSVANSRIANLNILNSIYSYEFGSGNGGEGTTVIAPVTVMDNVNANVANVFNTMVNVNCNIDMSDMSGMVEGMRADILAKITQ